MNWFTSDTHFGHKNIVRGPSSWENKDRCRDFDTLEEHNQALVDNINACVQKDDTLYHMGDWSFGGIQNIWEFRKQLNCENIHLILGNHDHHIERNSILPNCFDDADDNLLDKPPFHYGDARDDLFRVNAQQLFSSVQHYKEVKMEGTKVILCHYAMRVWNLSHRGSIMLYGHSHGTLDAVRPHTANPTWIGDDYFIRTIRTMDVGIDTHPDFRPYSEEEIWTKMRVRTVDLEVDHHNKKTT